MCLGSNSDLALSLKMEFEHLRQIGSLYKEEEHEDVYLFPTIRNHGTF